MPVVCDEYTSLSSRNLQRCFEGKRILFVGDSQMRFRRVFLPGNSYKADSHVSVFLKRVALLPNISGRFPPPPGLCVFYRVPSNTPATGTGHLGHEGPDPKINEVSHIFIQNFFKQSFFILMTKNYQNRQEIQMSTNEKGMFSVSRFSPPNIGIDYRRSAYFQSRFPRLVFKDGISQKNSKRLIVPNPHHWLSFSAFLLPPIKIQFFSLIFICSFQQTMQKYQLLRCS